MWVERWGRWTADTEHATAVVWRSEQYQADWHWSVRATLYWPLLAVRRGRHPQLGIAKAKALQVALATTPKTPCDWCGLAVGTHLMVRPEYRVISCDNAREEARRD